MCAYKTENKTKNKIMKLLNNINFSFLFVLTDFGIL